MHWYGKAEVKRQRKVGHVTVTAATPAEARARLALIDAAAAKSLESTAPAAAPASAAVPASAAPSAAAPRVCCTEPVLIVPGLPMFFSDTARSRSDTVAHCLCQPPGARVSMLQPAVQVGVIMGSDSDLATMAAAAQVRIRKHTVFSRDGQLITPGAAPLAPCFLFVPVS